MKKKSSRRPERKSTRAKTSAELSVTRKGPAKVTRERGFLETLKARYPSLFDVMYRRVDSPRYFEFESELEAKQENIRKRGTK